MLGFISSAPRLKLSTRPVAVLVSCLGLALLAVGTASLAREAATSAYASTGYYGATFLFLFWVWAGIEFLRAGVARRLLERPHLIAIGAAAALTVALCSSVERRFRVLSDETNQVSVSQAMITHRTIYNHTMNKWSPDGLQPLSSGLDQRPLMFPYFVHLLHALRGFRADNAFLVNAGAMFALLAAVGLAVTRRLGPASGLCAMVLAATPPIFAISGTSAGFDFFSTAIAVVCFAALYYYWEKPTPDRLAFLWGNLVLLMNTRYESAVLAAGLMGGLAAAGKLRTSFVTARPWFYGLSVLLLVPLVVQRIVTSVSANTPAGTPSFHVRHLWKWTGELLSAQLRWDPALPYAWALNWLALPIAGWAVYRLWQKRRSGEAWSGPTTIVLAALTLHLGCILSFYSSSYTHAASERYFLLLSIATALSPLGLHVMLPHLMTVSRLGTVAAASFLIYHPVAVRDISSGTLVAVRQFDFQREALAPLPPQNTLVITPRPGQVSALGYGAIDFSYANNRRFELVQEIANHRYRGVYVFQRITSITGNPVASDQLDAMYQIVRVVTERQITHEESIRLCEIGKK